MKNEIIENAKIMINIAQSDFFFSPEEDQEPRFIQAFLLQASIIEGLIKEFADDLNKKNKIQGVKQARNFHQACRESRIVNGIKGKDFKKLSEYIDFRNDLVHRILEKDNLPSFEEKINQKYKDGSDIIDILLN